MLPVARKKPMLEIPATAPVLSKHGADGLRLREART
jgi:hypothetical protein